jgi:hypothetical protein
MNSYEVGLVFIPFYVWKLRTQKGWTTSVQLVNGGASIQTKIVGSRIYFLNC